MPDQSQTSPAAFNCEGGLVLNKSTFLMEPGEALELRNFEPDIEGGYRRINGFSKYVSAVVPYTSSASEKILMVASFSDVVLAARGTSIYSATPGVLVGHQEIQVEQVQLSITLKDLTLTVRIR